MRRFFIRIGALAHKETLHLVRDRQALALAIVMPVLLVLLFGFAVSFDIELISIVVLDRDRSAESRAFVAAMASSSAFRIDGTIGSEDEVEPMFRKGLVKAALIIPQGHAKSLARGDRAEVQILVDGADGTTANVALGYALAVARDRTELRLRAAGAPGALPIDPRVRTWFNPALKSELFVVPGLVGVVLAVIGVLLSALTVAREWERGSMEQLFATPVGRLPVVLGKLLPYVALGIVQLLLVLSAGVWLFDVPLRGSFFLLVFASTLFLISLLGQGFLISTITKSQQLATQLGAASAILPAMLLSGFLFPIENMPPVLYGVAQVIPARYLLPILRGIMLQGRGIAELARELTGLCILSFLIVTACTLRFRRRLD
jgi:ABC-2 type transport system permease protein